MGMDGSRFDCRLENNPTTSSLLLLSPRAGKCCRKACSIRVFDRQEKHETMQTMTVEIDKGC